MTDQTKLAPRYGVPSIAAAIVFALLYAYVLWTAIGNLVELPKALGAATPWALLVVDAVLPLVAFGTAFWLGRRRTPGLRALLFLMGLALLACSTVGSIAYVQTH